MRSPWTWAALCVACSGPRATTAPGVAGESASPTASPPAGTAPPSTSAPDVPAALVCGDGGEAPFSPVVPSRRGARVAGQMSQEAAASKRAYDREAWADAEAGLARVADGTTGDDEGNRQIATYQRGIALWRLERYTEALAVFRAIAADRDHLKWHETILWLGRLVERDDTAHGALEALAAYDDDDVRRFENPQQRELAATLSLAFGRVFLLTGDAAHARRHLLQVGPESRWHTAAQACLARLRD